MRVTDDRKTTVAIVEDHQPFREYLEKTLSGYKQLDVVLTSPDGKAFLQALPTLPLKPQVVLMDLEMPELNGVDTTKQLLKLHSDIVVAILSVHESAQYILDSIYAGANGYILKNNIQVHELPQIIQALADGHSYTSPKITSTTFKYLREHLVRNHATESEIPLTEREKEVLQRLITGQSAKEMAADIHIAVSTVQKHVSNIYRKLGVSNRVEASRLALSKGWFKRIDKDTPYGT
ncbi:response regulator [Eisenibacter elegans]|uniref:response regulator transcription factor n=1 Tax=Eisenibacter elegans TaxID=997 RepID=UPI00041CF6A1|nr:response regulator transcription factor [Eisenibacter elegans]